MPFFAGDSFIDPAKGTTRKIPLPLRKSIRFIMLQITFREGAKILPLPALLQKSPEARALLVLGHGAGAPMTHPFFEELCHRLSAKGIATLRFNFPYMAEGKKVPDRKPRALAAWEAVLRQGGTWAKGLPLFAGGKSYGGRMLSLLFAERPELALPQPVQGLVFYGYPLHPAGKPDKLRVVHLDAIRKPMCFFQGTRDALAQPELVAQHLARLPQAQVVVVEGGDHSFKVLKRSGIAQEAVWDLLAARTAAWIDAVLTSD